MSISSEGIADDAAVLAGYQFTAHQQYLDFTFSGLRSRAGIASRFHPARSLSHLSRSLR